MAGFVDEILSREDDLAFSQSLVEAINCRSEEEYVRLPQILRVPVVVFSFFLETNGGGFQQLLTSSLGKAELGDILVALRLVKARSALRTLETLGKRFPFGTVAEEVEDRLEQVETIIRESGTEVFETEDLWYRRSGENTLQLLRHYLISRKGELSQALESWNPSIGASIDDILDLEQEEIIPRLRDHLLLDRVPRVGWKGLTEAERTFTVVSELLREVGEGGLQGYLWNPASDRAATAVSALRSIGAVRAAGLIDDSLRLFGEEGLQQVQERRQDQVMNLSDDACDRLEQLSEAFEASEEATERLLSWTIRNRSSFRE